MKWVIVREVWIPYVPKEDNLLNSRLFSRCVHGATKRSIIIEIIVMLAIK